MLDQQPTTARRIQRREPRLPFDPAVPCQVVDPANHRSWPAWVRDISTMGISVLLDAHFSVGDILIVEVCLPGQIDKLQREMEVRHSEICFPNNAWLHGCLFRNALGEKDFAQLVWSAAKSEL